MIALLVSLGAGAARGESHVTIRGQYYRETSTRVIQPVAEIAADLPSGVDVRTHYLLDAITSASAASGPAGDRIFTEYRNEVGLGIGKTWSRLRLGAAYRYSAESDYWSHTGVLSAAMRLWQDTATLALNFGMGFDQVGRRSQAAVPPSLDQGPCVPRGGDTCPLDTIFGGAGYSQVLSPTALLQVGYEFALLTGFLASPYRPEVLPDRRLRNAVAARVAKYFPGSRTGLQLHYRYYWDLYPGGDPGGRGDPWGITSHAVEARLYQRLGRDVELRLTGRLYPQGPANFWCDVALSPGCNLGWRYTAASPYLGPVNTTFLEAKVYWDAVALREVPILGWFSAGTFELSYGRFLQDTSFGDAHILQTGYHLPY